jgi:glutamine amidotransferase
MHNGGIADFPLIKRKLQAVLSDEIFNVVQGNTGRSYALLLVFHGLFHKTDSEWAFALFLSKANLS